MIEMEVWQQAAGPESRGFEVKSSTANTKQKEQAERVVLL